MKFALLIKPVLIGLTVFTLAACSTTGDKDEIMPGSAEAEAADASGLGEEFGFQGKGRSTLNVENQTYYFDFDKSTVKPEDRASIDVQAKHMATNPSAKVLLEGNTDPRGSREYNIALGERRAEAVADALKLQGAAPSQIRVISYGAEKRASSGNSEEDYELDRRANLVYESK